MLFFGREELPFTESALGPLFERCPAATTPDLAIVMEPTANAIEVGCICNLNAKVTVTQTGTDPQGAKVSSVAVYDKQ